MFEAGKPKCNNNEALFCYFAIGVQEDKSYWEKIVAATKVENGAGDRRYIFMTVFDKGIVLVFLEVRHQFDEHVNQGRPVPTVKLCRSEGLSDHSKLDFEIKMCSLGFQTDMKHRCCFHC